MNIVVDMEYSWNLFQAPIVLLVQTQYAPKELSVFGLIMCVRLYLIDNDAH